MKSRYLLDTMVLSENFKKVPASAVIDWLNRVSPDTLAISVITLGEIAVGIEKQRLKDPRAFEQLRVWLADVQREYESRTVPVDAPAALRWGTMCSQLKRRDTDLLIAATALEHGLTVVTRNVRHFEPTGVKLLNPYAPA